jgi:mono/diheme cytochrome c family protein
MRKHVGMGVIAAGALLAAIAGGACTQSQTKSHAAKVERGKYLVTVGGCNDCHTPLKLGPRGPEPDMSRMLSGHPENFPIVEGTRPASDAWMMTASASGTAFSGPWGVSFTANLTPDQNTGLGIWTEDMFMKALRTGRHMGASREILPPMPWFNYREMSDADLKAVYAYLRTIPAIHNRVPAPLPPAAPQTARNMSSQSAWATAAAQ